MGLFVGYDHFVRARPEPTLSPLATAARTYVKTLPEAYSSAARQVSEGALTDKAAVVRALQDHARPLSMALESALTPVVDGKGKITNPAIAADVLDQTAKALGGK